MSDRLNVAEHDVRKQGVHQAGILVVVSELVAFPLRPDDDADTDADTDDAKP